MRATTTWDSLYEVRDDDRRLFGEHWVGPKVFEPHTKTLVAAYEVTHEDGERVEVYCEAWPARFLTLRVGGKEVAAFASGIRPLAIAMAKAIADADLTLRAPKGERTVANPEG